MRAIPFFEQARRAERDEPSQERFDVYGEVIPVNCGHIFAGNSETLRLRKFWDRLLNSRFHEIDAARAKH